MKTATHAVVLLSLLLAVAGCSRAVAEGPASRPGKLGAGDHKLELTVDGNARTFLVHVPLGYDPGKATPVVLIYHGAWSNGAMMAAFCGLNAKADAAGFVAVYPEGMGVGTMRFFNAWAPPAKTGRPADDVKFTAAILDDLAGRIHVDARRVFATGMSNGGMMCYRVAAELAGRIAAIAPVAGTQAFEKAAPARPVPVLHFHGTADTFVPFQGGGRTLPRIAFKGVDETVKAWAKIDGCPETPATADLPAAVKDGTTVRRSVYGPGRDGAEVVLYVIAGGGHTWPGRPAPVALLGKTTANISANDLIWDFFRKHPMPAPAGNPAPRRL